MTDLKFEINGVDFSDIVTKRSYETSLDPVIGSQWVDLDKVRHTKVSRYRGGLMIEVNPSLTGRTAEFCAVLMSAPVLVDYHNFQRGTDVQERMMPDLPTLRDALKLGDKRWLRASEIIFTQE